MALIVVEVVLEAHFIVVVVFEADGIITTSICPNLITAHSHVVFWKLGGVKSIVEVSVSSQRVSR